jgi:hypothetical protein
MHNIKVNFDKVFEITKKLMEDLTTNEGNFIRTGPKPKFSDLEVIALNLTSEYLSIDSENYLFKKLENDYKDSFPHLIERSQYNKRKRKLFPYIEELRKRLSDCFAINEDYFVIDSMPLEICKNSRINRSKICKENYVTSPERGYCASQKSYYYGYKLHGMCTVNGVFTSIDLTKANVHDVAYLQEVKFKVSDCVLLGDKGYIDSQVQLNLFDHANVKLETPLRNNQKNFKVYPYIFRKVRKRIETLYSQLCDQFMIRRNYAKSFKGFKTRILSKITAMTVVQYINKFILNRSLKF